jgi:hypothetical protein
LSRVARLRADGAADPRDRDRRIAESRWVGACQPLVTIATRPCRWDVAAPILIRRSSVITPVGLLPNQDRVLRGALRSRIRAFERKQCPIKKRREVARSGCSASESRPCSLILRRFGKTDGATAESRSDRQRVEPVAAGDLDSAVVGLRRRSSSRIGPYDEEAVTARDLDSAVVAPTELQPNRDRTRNLWVAAPPAILIRR